jgi:hypothetical protein
MNTKNKTDHRMPSKGQPYRMSISVTGDDYRVIKEKAQKAGLGISAYFREITFNGQVTARLTEEELAFFRATVGLSNDLHQLVKLARAEGITSVLPLFESYRNRIDNALNKMNL